MPAPAETGQPAWVLSGPGLPCGARILGEALADRVWVDVCLIGQHLPQMYRPADIYGLDAAGCARLGLCPGCCGFGDLDPKPAAGMLEAARGVDQLTSPCPDCGGSGRPAIRSGVIRSGGSVQGTMKPLPHLYVPPLDGVGVPLVGVPLGQASELAASFGVPPGFCLACGMHQDDLGPAGEPLHVTDQPG